MRARKRFGQNFLNDQLTIQGIIDAIRPSASDHVLEIGPGHGALTESLVASGCQLDVVEIDRDLAAELRQRYPGLNVIEADILKFDFNQIRGGRPLRVVGNLPYNISTPLLFMLFEKLDIIEDMYFMLQLEVVERMAAAASTSQYGRLSIMSQYFCAAEKLFDVPPSAFTPAPKVTSAVVQMIPHAQRTPLQDRLLFQSLVVQAFSQRRKTVRNALKRYLSGSELLALGIDPEQRPETITGFEYIQCANYLSARDVPAPTQLATSSEFSG